MPFTELYCQLGGSNLNTGRDINNSPIYSTTNGNWNGTTTFTPTDGSTPANFINVGDWVSLFLDAASVAAAIKKVTAVAGGVNGAITVDNTTNAYAGVNPTSGATGRSLRLGGAWLGISGTQGFPFSSLTLVGIMKNANGDRVRVNIKGDRTITSTGAVMSTSQTQPCTFQGYGSTPGDQVKVTLDYGSVSNSGGIITLSNVDVVDFIFTSTNVTSGNFTNAASNALYRRCIFYGIGQAAIVLGANSSAIECEIFAACRSNSVNVGAINCPAIGPCTIDSCVIHDITAGSNVNGICVNGATVVNIKNTILTNISGKGIRIVTGPSYVSITQNDFYNVLDDAIFVASSFNLDIKNSNFINCVRGVNVGGNNMGGQIANCGYGSGSMANTNPDIRGSLEDLDNHVIYPLDQTPWRDPDYGDFSIAIPQALNAGRSVFPIGGFAYTPNPGFNYYRAQTRYVTNGGTGYVAGDILTAIGGTFTSPARLHVHQVGFGGSIRFEDGGNCWFDTDFGIYSAVPPNDVSFSGGHGTGATARLTWIFVYVPPIPPPLRTTILGFPDIGAVQHIGIFGGPPPGDGGPPPPPPPPPPGEEGGRGAGQGRAPITAKMLQDLTTRARKAVSDFENLDIVGPGISKNPHGPGFMFNP